MNKIQYTSKLMPSLGNGLNTLTLMYFCLIAFRFVRAEHYRYVYTKIGSKEAQSGKWWKRMRIGQYLQPVNLDALKQYLTQMGWKTGSKSSKTK